MEFKQPEQIRAMITHNYFYKYRSYWEFGKLMFYEKVPNFKISQVNNSEYILKFKG